MAVLVCGRFRRPHHISDADFLFEFNVCRERNKVTFAVNWGVGDFYVTYSIATNSNGCTYVFGVNEANATTIDIARRRPTSEMNMATTKPEVGRCRS